MTFAPNDAGAGPARLPMQFGIAKILIALQLLAAAANVGEFAYDRTPGPLGFLATVLLGAAWVGLAWFKGGAGPTRFPRVAAVVWAVLLGVTALIGWAARGSLDPTVGIPAAFVAITPFHGIAGLLPLPRVVNYLAVMVGIAAATAGAFVAGRSRASWGGTKGA